MPPEEGESQAAEADRPSLSTGLGFAGLSFVLLGTLSVATSIVLARAYGVDVVGQIALATAPMNALWFLSTVGEQPAMIRLIAPLRRRAPRVTSLFGATFAFSSLLTLVVATLMGAGSILLFHGPLHHPGLVPAALFQLGMYIVLVNSCWNIDGVFAAFGDGRQLFLVRLTQTGVYLAGLVAFSGPRPDVWGPILALAVSWVVSLAHRLAVLPRYVALRGGAARSREGLEEMPGIIRFGLKLTPGTIALGLSDEAGTWILGSTRSIAEVGAYSRAWLLARRLVELNWRVSEMLYPTLVTRRQEPSRHGFDRALLDSLRYSTLALLAPVAAGSGAAAGIMHLFGPGFGSAAPTLRILLLVPVLVTAGAVQNAALLALERPLTATVVNCFRLVVTVGLGIPLAHAAGLTGMAWSVLAGVAVSLAMQSVLLYRHRPVPFTRLWPVRQLMAVPLAYGAGFLASAEVERLGHGPAVLVLALAAGLLAFVLVALIVGTLNDRDRVRVRRAVALIRRRPDPASPTGRRSSS